jgi:hypothetical protein
MKFDVWRFRSDLSRFGGDLGVGDRLRTGVMVVFLQLGVEGV